MPFPTLCLFYLLPAAAEVGEKISRRVIRREIAAAIIKPALMLRDALTMTPLTSKCMRCRRGDFFLWTVNMAF